MGNPFPMNTFERITFIKWRHRNFALGGCDSIQATKKKIEMVFCKFRHLYSGRIVKCVIMNGNYLLRRPHASQDPLKNIIFLKVNGKNRIFIFGSWTIVDLYNILEFFQHSPLLSWKHFMCMSFVYAYGQSSHWDNKSGLIHST